MCRLWDPKTATISGKRNHPGRTDCPILLPCKTDVSEEKNRHPLPRSGDLQTQHWDGS